MSEMSAMRGRSSVSDDSCARDAGRRSAIRVEDAITLSRPILHCANRGLPRVGFHREVLQVPLDFSGSDAIEVRLNDDDLHGRWKAIRRRENVAGFELLHWTSGEDGAVMHAMPDKRRQPDLSDVKKSVILTGAMRPSEFRDIDAVQNVIEALFACALLDSSMRVVMHSQAVHSPGVAKDGDRMTFVRRGE